jgi:hypothetical protein
MSELKIEYWPLSKAIGLRWQENPKLHDIAKLKDSIRRYGFRDPIGWDKTLGAFVEGNGRAQALLELKEAGDKPPRAVVVKDGDWLIPVLVGVNAANKAEAIAYAIDHNNMVLSGSPLTPIDMASLWSAGDFKLLLEGLKAENTLPVSFEVSDVDDIISAVDKALEWDTDIDVEQYLRGSKKPDDEREKVVLLCEPGDRTAIVDAITKYIGTRYKIELKKDRVW